MKKLILILSILVGIASFLLAADPLLEICVNKNGVYYEGDPLRVWVDIQYANEPTNRNYDLLFAILADMVPADFFWFPNWDSEMHSEPVFIPANNSSYINKEIIPYTVDCVTNPLTGYLLADYSFGADLYAVLVAQGEYPLRIVSNVAHKHLDFIGNTPTPTSTPTMTPTLTPTPTQILTPTPSPTAAFIHGKLYFDDSDPYGVLFIALISCSGDTVYTKSIRKKTSPVSFSELFWNDTYYIYACRQEYVPTVSDSFEEYHSCRDQYGYFGSVFPTPDPIILDGHDVADIEIFLQWAPSCTPTPVPTETPLPTATP